MKSKTNAFRVRKLQHLFNLGGTAAEVGLQTCETFCLCSYKVTYLGNEMKCVLGTKVITVFHTFYFGALCIVRSTSIKKSVQHLRFSQNCQ
jgi:hypothetical protein